jgi:hypothetical protein
MGGGKRMSMELKSPQININLRILPFGRAIVEIRGGEQKEQKEEKEEKKISVYKKPEITNVEIYEITSSGLNYVTPKTTGGL